MMENPYKGDDERSKRWAEEMMKSQELLKYAQIPNPFEGRDLDKEANDWADELESRGGDTEATDVEALRTAVLLYSQALKKMYITVAELVAHVNEHHKVLDSHARSLTMLEALLIGGEDELPS